MTTDLPGAGRHDSSRNGTELKRLPLAELSIGYSPRQVKLDEQHVAALMEVVDRLPPIIVDKRTGTVLDGAHRLEAFRRTGRAQIEAVLFSGTEIDALAVAVQANVTHGKPLSRLERHAAAAHLLQRSPERSDRWVADVCGLSHTTVARIRQANAIFSSSVRTGKDGRRRRIDLVARQSTSRPVGGTSHNTWKTSGTRKWLARTVIDCTDLNTYLRDVNLRDIPTTHIHMLIDECQSRAVIWNEATNRLKQEFEARASSTTGTPTPAGPGPVDPSPGPS